MKFEPSGNIATFNFTTNFGLPVSIICKKTSDQSFRFGGTAINSIAFYEGIILSIDGQKANVRAYLNPDKFINIDGMLAPQGFSDKEHCYVNEYYDLEMNQSWLISREPIQNANLIFINVDCLDQNGNIIRRYRVSPFFGDYKIICEL